MVQKNSLQGHLTHRLVLVAQKRVLLGLPLATNAAAIWITGSAAASGWLTGDSGARHALK
jgi:hypothetical protein